MIEHAGGIVENIAIHLAKGHHCLKWIPQGVIYSDQICCEEGERAPAELRSMSVRIGRLSSFSTYRGDRLHAQYERIRCEVPRVRESVLFPQLAENVLCRSHACMV